VALALTLLSLLTPGILFGGTILPGGLGQKCPIGLQGRSPGRGFGDEFSQKLKQFADTVYRF